jgi:hypothetical protein
MSRQLALRLSPLVAFYEVDMPEAEELLIAWRHPLHLPVERCPSCGKPHPDGRPYERPYTRIPFVMEDRGRVAACVVLASTINTSVCKARGWHRYNTVDLARIARSDDWRDAKSLRAVLRITREYLVPLWLGRSAKWDAVSAQMNGRPQVTALAASSLPGTPGSMYRLDGFEKIRTSKPKAASGRQNVSAANAIADGATGLWVYQYPQALTP